MEKLYILILSTLFLSCNTKIEENKIDLKAILKNEISFQKYFKEKINGKISFEANFKDTTNQIIDPKQFYEFLFTGEFIPIQENMNTFTLAKLSEIQKKKYGPILAHFATVKLDQLTLINKDFPQVDFLNTLTPKKYLVVKFWFLACPPCIEEIPACNRLVETYMENTNFVALTWDKDEKISQSKLVKDFKYKMIGNQKDLIVNQLEIQGFPTHLVVENGKIIFVCDNVNTLKDFLSKL